MIMGHASKEILEASLNSPRVGYEPLLYIQSS